MHNTAKAENKNLLIDSDNTIINRLETDAQFRAEYKREIMEAVGTEEAEVMLKVLVQSPKGCIEIASALYMEWKLS